MAKVILHQLAPTDSPIYNQPLMIGGFSKPLSPNTQNLSPMDYTLALIGTETNPTKEWGGKCQSES